jgi:hypothetical protein
MVRIHVIDPEDSPAPPTMLESRTCDEIDVRGTRFQTAERSPLAAINQLKATLASPL